MAFHLSTAAKGAGALVFASALTFSAAVQATVVEIRTNMGNIQVNLFDQLTPRTVDNFLTNYVVTGAYANNVAHRSVPDFIVQMGGFQYTNTFPPEAISTAAAVVNEPVLSNLRGTVAMAKVGGNPNSATSQFFINTNDNQANLDVQNGGFTVFGQVIGDGMTVVDAINELTRFGFSSPFNEIPLRNYTAADLNNNVNPTDNNLVIITDVVVIDAAVNTNPNLNPTRNTLINRPPAEVGGDSGGSMGILLLLGLFLLGLKRRLL